MPNCAKCNGNITSNRIRVNCAECYIVLHSKCAKVSDDGLKRILDGKETWFCDSCKIGREGATTDGVSNENHTTASLPDVMRLLMELKGRMINIETSQQFTSQFIEELTSKIDFVTNENKSLKIQLENLETKLMVNEQKVQKFEALLDIKNRESIRNDLVIFGLPDDADNNERNVDRILNLLQAPVPMTDIISIKPVKYNSASGSSNVRLVVKFANKQSKDAIINTFRKNKKNMCLSELDLTSPNCNTNQKIIITHHLSSLQSRLYGEAKKFKLKHNFRYLWVQDNNILLRQQNDSKIFRIDSFNDICYLQRIHG